MTVVPDTDLMEAFSEQIAWQNHLAVKVAEADIEEAEAEAHLDTVKAVAMLSAPTDKLNQQRLARDADEVVAQAKKDLRVVHARRKLLQVMMENRERAANLISRELTRRVGREGPQRRNDRWTP